MKKISFLFVKAFVVLNLICFMSACDGSEKDDDGNTVPDPVGTITANISEGTSYIKLRGDNGSCRVKWVAPDNIYIEGDFYGNSSKDTYYNVSICNVGQVNGLGAITKIQTSGYTNPTSGSDRTLSCDAGYGYIIKIEQREITGTYPNYNYVTKGTTYARMYVVESIVSTGGGIMGAKVKYQYPFKP